MRRAEEILEIAEILDETADIRDGSRAVRRGQMHPPQTLREIARCELELAVVDVACLIRHGVEGSKNTEALQRADAAFLRALLERDMPALGTPISETSSSR